VQAGRVVRVLVDEPAIDKTFDYLLPESLIGSSDVRLGSLVRVPLHGRRVGAWVVGLNVVPAVPMESLLSVTKVSSFGPPREILSLARWASWRWWGRPATFLTIASPKVSVRGLPAGRPLDPAALPPGDPTLLGIGLDELVRALSTSAASVVRLGPLVDPFSLVLEAARFVGGAGLLVVAPQVSTARDLARRLRRLGAPVALVPDEWARATVPGTIVIGARTAAWAPLPSFGAAIVLDEHDEAYQDERAPTWHAREVVAERAARLGVPCLLVSPVPSPHAVALAGGKVVAPDRRDERTRWPIVTLIDRTVEEPGRVPIVAPGLTSILRNGGRVVCVLNRSGRAKLLDCRSCQSLVECERCGAAMSLPAGGDVLVCGRCQATSPVVCSHCGGGRLRHIRPGTTRLRDDIEALAKRPTVELTGDRGEVAFDDADVFVGTEAALHRVGRADTVVFLDIDGELLAPRMRACDATVALVVRAARLVGPEGRVVLVTRQPESPILRALTLGDAAGLSDALTDNLSALKYEPPAAVARIQGVGAVEIAEGLRPLSQEHGLAQIGPAAGPFLVRAESIDALADALSHVDRPPLRVRVEIDPVRW
jgi:primosomal protein N' (replication factor Y) (superfamily II helicase)